jgi:hypothetical protein
MKPGLRPDRACHPLPVRHYALAFTATPIVRYCSTRAGNHGHRVNRHLPLHLVSLRIGGHVAPPHRPRNHKNPPQRHKGHEDSDENRRSLTALSILLGALRTFVVNFFARADTNLPIKWRYFAGPHSIRPIAPVQRLPQDRNRTFDRSYNPEAPAEAMGIGHEKCYRHLRAVAARKLATDPRGQQRIFNTNKRNCTQMSADLWSNNLTNGELVLSVGPTEWSSGRFDLRASLLICVHLRSNFLRSVRTGPAIRHDPMSPPGQGCRDPGSHRCDVCPTCAGLADAPKTVQSCIGLSARPHRLAPAGMI